LVGCALAKRARGNVKERAKKSPVEQLEKSLGERSVSRSQRDTPKKRCQGKE